MFLFDISDWTLLQSSLVFLLCTLVIAVAGILMTSVVDHLADRTGIGEATAGAVLLGASTSLSGAVLSVSAAWSGYPQLAIGNALGGIAVQTFFLAIADLAYRRANLEHAAASEANLMQCALLICLIAIILLAPFLPSYTFWHIHGISFLIIGFYVYGIRLVHRARSAPMWRPSKTRETREDRVEEASMAHSLGNLWSKYLVLMAVLGFSGWFLEQAAAKIILQTGISEATVGVLFTAISTSLPELVTSVAAVRRGALTLAVGGIIGGNAFDTLFTAASDMAYRDGSIYHAMARDTQFWLALTLVMSGILMMGLIRRERSGPANIGMESTVIILLYFGGVLVLLN